MQFPKFDEMKKYKNEPIIKFSELPTEIVYHMYNVKSLKQKMDKLRGLQNSKQKTAHTINLGCLVH